MRHTLAEWYEPDSSTLREILQKGTIALDANILLDLYRIGADQRAQILKLFEKAAVRPRMWIPYQAAYEYQKNRLKVAKQHKPQYGNLVNKVLDLRELLTPTLNEIRDADVRREISIVLDTNLKPAVEAIQAALKEFEKQHVIAYEEIRSSDPLRRSIDQIFRDKFQVGPKLSDKEIDERKEKAKDRYEKEIPPGYKDKNKSENAEGDALVWFEILDHASAIDRPVLLVTSDVKEDWYSRDSGHTIGPRVELRAEFAAVSSHPYHQVSLSSFLHLANTHLDAKVLPDTISTVEALSDQKREEQQSRRQMREANSKVHAFIRQAMADVQDDFPPGCVPYERLRIGREILEGKVDYDQEQLALALKVLVGALSLQRSGGQDAEVGDHSASQWLRSATERYGDVDLNNLLGPITNEIFTDDRNDTFAQMERGLRLRQRIRELREATDRREKQAILDGVDDGAGAMSGLSNLNDDSA